MTQKPPPYRDWYAHEFANYFNRVFDELESKPPTWATAWTQNLSVARADLIEVGGFDAGLAKNFDIELAFRLWQSGLTARYLRGAHTVHDDGKGRAGLLADAKLHGTNYVELAERHPEMLPQLLGWFGDASPRELMLRRLLIALRVPAALLAPLGPLLPGAGRRQIWFTFVARYAFWLSARRSMNREKWARITHGVPVLS
jgi:GT2 family glycosyltransferase